MTKTCYEEQAREALLDVLAGLDIAVEYMSRLVRMDDTKEALRIIDNIDTDRAHSKGDIDMTCFDSLKSYIDPPFYIKTVSLHLVVDIDRDRLTKIMPDIHNDYDLLYMLGEEIGSKDEAVKLVNFVETQEER